MRLPGRKKGTPRIDPATLASLVAGRCAALLRGGMSPAQAVRAMHADVQAPETAQIIELIDSGAPIHAAFARADGPEWRVLGAAWQLAEQSGAPFAPALDRIAAALSSIAEANRKRSVMLAGPKMTAALVSWLPLAAVVVSFVLGFDPLPVFLTPFGVVLLATGAALQAVGMRWTRVLTDRVAGRDRVAGLECELTWVALSGGAPPDLALRRVVDAVADARAEWITFDSLRAGRPLARGLDMAAAAGVPASALLIDTATELRAETQAEIERDTERLGIRILIPLAVCVLPAFIAVGVVPVIVTLLGDVLVV